MGFTLTFAGLGASLLLLLVAARMQARRGIGRASLVPWDYLMILAVIGLLAAAVHLAELWRDSRPL
jgi:DMSO reductase anchor subunit